MQRLPSGRRSAPRAWRCPAARENYLLRPALAKATIARVNCRIVQSSGVLTMANRTEKDASAKPANPQGQALPSTREAGRTESRPPSSSKPNSLLASSLVPVSAEARQAMIAQAAYYIAEQRGFGEGHAVEDWLLAEKHIDATLAA